MSTITIGADLPKSVFSVHEAGHVVRRQDPRRGPFGLWLAQQPAGTVAMEACSGAHHWTRRCLAYGLQQRLIAVQLVTLFRKDRKTKDDRADAEGSPRRRARATCASCLSENPGQLTPSP